MLSRKNVNNNINKDRFVKTKNNKIINTGISPSLQLCTYKAERFAIWSVTDTLRAEPLLSLFALSFLRYKAYVP